MKQMGHFETMARSRRAWESLYEGALAWHRGSQWCSAATVKQCQTDEGDRMARLVEAGTVKLEAAAAELYRIGYRPKPKARVKAAAIDAAIGRVK